MKKKTQMKKKHTNEEQSNRVVESQPKYVSNTYFTTTDSVLVCTCTSLRGITLKHLYVSLITDITFIQARQAISDEPKASQTLSWRD